MENNKIADLQKQYESNIKMISLINKSTIADLVLTVKEKSDIIEKLIDSNLRIYGEILRKISTKTNDNQKDNKQNEKSKTKEKQDNQHKHNSNKQSHDKQNDKKDSYKTPLLKTKGLIIFVTNKNGVEFINVSNEKNNKINVATYIKDNRCTGISKCNPEDVFDLEIGFCIAFARAILGEDYNDIIKDIKNELKIEE